MARASSLRRPRPKRSERAVRHRIRDFAATTYRGTILDAAERLFVEVGYQDAKMSDLARASGVSVGTLYNYFASKLSS